MSAPSGERWVVDFSEGSREQRDLLGGKGANVAEMTRVLGAEMVPAGFTVTTAACAQFLASGGAFPDGLEDEIEEALTRLEGRAAARLGDGERPLLVVVFKLGALAEGDKREADQCAGQKDRDHAGQDSAR